MDHSRGQIDRAGRLLADRLAAHREHGEKGLDSFDPKAVDEAMRIVEAWRRLHSKPLASISANLRYYVAGHGYPLVTQRLKRYPTVIDKLVREPRMKLSRMADIGGVRAVLPDQSAAYAVSRRLRKNWTVVRFRDYVAEPKDDGYRSLHLNVRRRGRLTEVQLRTPLQHAWANLVEQNSRWLGVDLKSGHGPPDVLARYRELAEQGARIESGSTDVSLMEVAMQSLLLLTDTLVRDKRKRRKR